MAATTTPINACDVHISVDDENGVLTAISGSSNNVSMEFTQELGEYRTYANGFVRRLACKKDASFSVTLVYTTASNEALDILKQWYFANAGTKKRTLQIDVPSQNVGNDRYTAEVFIESFSIPLDASEAGAVLVELALMPDGEVILTNIAT